MSEPARRSSVACWRRPSEQDGMFSGGGGGGLAAFGAHFWERRRGDDLLGWGGVLAECSTLRREVVGKGGEGSGD